MLPKGPHHSSSYNPTEGGQGRRELVVNSALVPQFILPTGPSRRPQGPRNRTGFGDRDVSTLTPRSRALTPRPHRGT